MKGYSPVPIARGVDKLGRISLPASMRHALGISTDDIVEVECDGERMTIRLLEAKCAICGATKDLYEIGPKHICGNCAGLAGLIKGDDLK